MKNSQYHALLGWMFALAGIIVSAQPGGTLVDIVAILFMYAAAILQAYHYHRTSAQEDSARRTPTTEELQGVKTYVEKELAKRQQKKEI